MYGIGEFEIIIILMSITSLIVAISVDETVNLDLEDVAIDKKMKEVEEYLND